MAHPVVSIITPLYNRVGLVSETIASVQRQTFRDWEMVVVDDGSTDGSYERVAALAAAEPRLRLVRRTATPRGAAACRNEGAAAARGAFLIFLDSDDLLAPHCLAQRVAAWKSYPTADFLVFPTLVFSEPDGALRHWAAPTDEPDVLRFLRREAAWQTTGPIFRREAFRRSGGFDASLICWQDYEFHLRLLLRGYCYQRLPGVAPDNYHRRHAGGLSQQLRPPGAQLRARRAVLRGLAGRLTARPPLLGAYRRALRENFQSQFRWFFAYLSVRENVALLLELARTGLFSRVELLALTPFLLALRATGQQWVPLPLRWLEKCKYPVARFFFRSSFRRAVLLNRSEASRAERLVFVSCRQALLRSPTVRTPS